MPPVRAGSHLIQQKLELGWHVASLPPGAVLCPNEMPVDVTWVSTGCLGTVAAMLQSVGQFQFENAFDFDVNDWWFRCSFDAPVQNDARQILHFGGLATLCDVWLNDMHVLSSENMFIEHRVDVTQHLRENNVMFIRCRSLSNEMKSRRPRPRWRAKMVANQQLRFFRTSLLGRMPSWSPPVAPVGPYRSIVLETSSTISIESVKVRSWIDGNTGHLSLDCQFIASGQKQPKSMAVRVANVETAIKIDRIADSRYRASGATACPGIELWWPHTHGAQPLYAVTAEILLDDGQVISVSLGEIGFRTIGRTSTAGFGLTVNGVDVFCRGAVWTPLDIVSLQASVQAYDEALMRVQSGGFNMLRLSGTMVPECDAFYDRCDRLGILVWHDLMFANMDYPVGDERFMSSATDEIHSLLSRIEHRPSLAVLCGSSEVEQQAAMLGLPPEQWKSPLFTETIPSILNARGVEVPYVTSTPTGGDLPFHVDVGVAHYYGVGAYLRPLDDARRANVGFAAECLAFANVPENEVVDRLLGDGETAPHHPKWKARVARDAGPGWDFDDVRDHYVQLLFAVDPAQLRYVSSSRYLELGRVASGEVMARTFAEWRRRGSTCHGALVWFLTDLWPGAGWGLVDASGQPKAAYWIMRRALAPTALLATDEGLNGLHFHLVNDQPLAIDADLQLWLFRHGNQQVAQCSRQVNLVERSVQTIRADAMLSTFIDSTYSYQFGSPNYDVAIATLRNRSTGEVISETFYTPDDAIRIRTDDIGLEAKVVDVASKSCSMLIHTRKTAFAVAVDSPGFAPDDNYFSLAPGAQKTVVFQRRSAALRFHGTIKALNSETALNLSASLRESSS